MNNLLELLNQSPYLNLVTAIIALASAIVALTPTPKPNSKLYYIYKLVEFIALNFGKAKDK